MRGAAWFCAVLVAATPIFVTAAEDPLSLRIGTYVPERSVGVQSVLVPWIEAVEAETAGEVSFTRYWGGSLGRNPYAQYELVRRGVLDLAWVLPGYTAGQFPQMGVVELPFLASDAESASVALWRIYSEGLAMSCNCYPVFAFAPPVRRRRNGWK
jgi:TRAP-type C4-dicarboxylate transport system substrate-binding protein